MNRHKIKALIALLSTALNPSCLDHITSNVLTWSVPGYRSVYRDLECQVAVVTDHQGLQEQLREVGTHRAVCMHAAYKRLTLMLIQRTLNNDGHVRSVQTNLPKMSLFQSIFILILEIHIQPDW